MDSLLRNHIGDVILQRDVIRDVRQDDVMIMHDADELPVREALLFLKVGKCTVSPAYNEQSVHTHWVLLTTSIQLQRTSDY